MSITFTRKRPPLLAHRRLQRVASTMDHMSISRRNVIRCAAGAALVAGPLVMHEPYDEVSAQDATPAASPVAAIGGNWPRMVGRLIDKYDSLLQWSEGI